MGGAVPCSTALHNRLPVYHVRTYVLLYIQREGERVLPVGISAEISVADIHPDM